MSGKSEEASRIVLLPPRTRTSLMLCLLWLWNTLTKDNKLSSSLACAAADLKIVLISSGCGRQKIYFFAYKTIIKLPCNVDLDFWISLMKPEHDIMHAEWLGLRIVDNKNAFWKLFVLC